jgi:hypothetical protein
VKAEFGKKISASTIIDNRFGSKAQFVVAYNHEFETNMIYNPYFRSIEQRERARSNASSKMWITNGKINRQLKKGNEIPLGWKKGRKC